MTLRDVNIANSPLWTQVGAAVGGGIAAAGTQRLLARPPRVDSFSAPNLKTSGLSANVSGGTVDLTRSAEASGQLQSLQQALGAQGADLKALLPLVEPGFGRLTEAGVNTIQGRARSSIGNLRDNLARRRIAGSSFATDALSRAEAEFAQEEANFRAQSFLQELQLKTELINQSAAATSKQFEVAIAQMNFESQVASDITRTVTDAIKTNASIQAQLAASNAAGQGKFMEPISSAVGGAVGQAIAGKFGGVAGSGVASAPVLAGTAGTAVLPGQVAAYNASLAPGANTVLAPAGGTSVAGGTSAAGGLAAGAGLITGAYAYGKYNSAKGKRQLGENIAKIDANRDSYVPEVVNNLQQLGINVTPEQVNSLSGAQLYDIQARLARWGSALPSIEVEDYPLSGAGNAKKLSVEEGRNYGTFYGILKAKANMGMMLSADETKWIQDFDRFSKSGLRK